MSKESKDLAAKAQWDSKRVLSLVVNNALMIIMIIAAIAIAIVNPNFVSASSIVNIISQTAAYLPAALGVLLALLVLLCVLVSRCAFKGSEKPAEPPTVQTPENKEPEPAEPLTLSQTALSLVAGESAALSASGGSAGVSWTSSNQDVATVENGTLTLSYEDISLDAGGYSAAAISPVAALPKLMQAAASGYVTEKSEETVGERPCLRLACDLPDDEGSVYTTWFDQETLLPLRSEISAEGTVVFEVAWTRFEVTGGGEPAVPAIPAEPGAPQEGTSDWTAADEAAAYASAEE